MNAINNNDQQNQKRSLKKVRRSFLNRRVVDDDQMNNDLAAIDSNEEKLSIDDLEDDSRNKTFVETKFLTSQVPIESILIEDDAQSKVVIFTLPANENSILVPWNEDQISARSYGDMNMAILSHQFQEYFDHFPMQKSFELLHSDDPVDFMSLRKSAMKARIKCKKIESEYPFRRYEFFTREEGVRLLTSSFSQKFIERLGYTLSEFVAWIELNGFPMLCDRDSPMNFGEFSDLFDSLTKRNEFIQEGPDYVTCCSDKDGNKVCFVVQAIFISEPTPEGFFGTAYVILKGKAGEKNKNFGEHNEEIKSHNSQNFSEDDGVNKEGNVE